MVVLLLLVVALILLGHGYLTESTDEVIAAGAVSVVAALIIVGSRLLARRREPADVETEPAGPAPSPSGREDRVARKVVFVAGRATFHDPGCAVVVDKATSSAERAELEAGGMQPCRRCLGTEPGPEIDQSLRIV